MYASILSRSRQRALLGVSRHIGQLTLLTFVLTLSSPPARSQCPTTNPLAPKLQRTWGGEIRKMFALPDPLNASNQLVWTVEEGARIAYSIDGGTSFTYATVPDNVRHALLGVFFLDPLDGWAVGKDGVVLRTTDGGANWFWATTNQAPVLRVDCDTDVVPYPATLWSIYFTDLNHGWLAGEGVLRQTINGGGDWTPLIVDAGGGGAGYYDREACWEFYDLDFASIGGGNIGLSSVEQNHGLNGAVFRTTNGTTWTLVTSYGGATITPHFEAWEVEFEPNPPTQGPAVAYLVGGPDGGNGRIFRSTDSGLNWVEEQRSCSVPYVACASFGGTMTSCCGNPLAWTCGDTHFHQICTPPPPLNVPPISTLYGLTVISANEAIAVGYGGERYRRQTNPTLWFEDTDRCEFSGPLTSVASAGGRVFVGGTWGYLFESSGAAPCAATGAMCYTNLRPDRSEHWRVFDVSFVDSRTGWMVGSQNVIMKTVDGGCHFVKEMPAPCGGQPVLRSVSTARVGVDDLGVVVGDNGQTWYHEKTLGGTFKWTDVTSPGVPTLWGVSYAPGTPATGFWAVGNSSTVRRSNANGATWSAVVWGASTSLPNGLPPGVKLSGITMLTPDDGFIVGEIGTVGVAYRISNGSQANPLVHDATPTGTVPALNAVASRGTSAAYAVGNQGVVYRYSSAVGVERFIAVPITYPASVASDMRDLYSIELVPGSTEAYAGGRLGLFLHSSSPSIGNSWTFPKSQTSKTIRAMQFFSSVEGFVLAQRNEPAERQSDQADGVLLVYR